MWFETLWNSTHQPLQWGVVICASLAAAVFDLAWRKIPNLLTFPLLLAGLIWALSFHGLVGLADSAAACATLMFPFVLLFIFAQGGAGDAKLMGAIGAWLGVMNGLAVLAGVSIMGIVFGLAYAATKRRFGRVVWAVYYTACNFMLRLVGRGVHGVNDLTAPTSSSLKMPYGLAICAGVCLSCAGVFIWRIWRK